MKNITTVRLLMIYSSILSIFFAQHTHASPESQQLDKNNYAYDEMLVFHIEKWNFFMNIDNNGYASINRGSAITIPRHFYPQILNYERVFDELDLEPLAHDEALQYWKDGSEYIYITRYKSEGEKTNYKTRSLDAVAHCLVAVANARLRPTAGTNQLREYLNLSFVTDAHLTAENNPYLLKNDSGATSVGEENEEIEGSRGNSRETEAEDGIEPAHPQASAEPAKQHSDRKAFRWMIYALLPLAAVLTVFILILRRQAK